MNSMSASNTQLDGDDDDKDDGGDGSSINNIDYHIQI